MRTLNTRTEAIAAVIAGVALLSGAGTYALWRQEVQMAPQTVTTGNLEVTVTTPFWLMSTNANGAGVGYDDNGDPIVLPLLPGSTLVGEAYVEVEADGFQSGQ